MAKNGSNNNDNMYDIARLLERMEDSFYRMSNQAQLSDPYTTRMRETSVVSVKDETNLLAKEIKSIMSEFRQDIKDMGLSTKEFTSAARELEKQILSKRSEGQEISTNYLERAKMAALSSWGTQSIRDIRADKEPMLAFNSEKAKGNENAKQLKSMLVSPIVDKLDEVKQSILGFMGEQEQRGKKERGKFLMDLIDGLGKSKTIGAILGDLAKLGALLGASWLRDFGPVGKALGAALVVVAPVLAKIMGDIIGKVIVNSLSGLWTGLTKVLGAMFNVGRFSRAASLAGKAGGLTTGLGRTAIASAAPAMLGYGLAATGVGAMAVDTWKSGNKAAGLTLGVGAAGFGAAMLAPLIPFLAPFAGIAVAVGAIATGVGLIIKHWNKIHNFLTDILERLGIIAKKDEKGEYEAGAPSFTEKFSASFRGESGTKLENLSRKSAGGQYAPVSDTTKKWETAKETKIKVDPETGAIMNLGKITRESLRDQLEQYKKSDPQKFYSLYSEVPFSAPYLSRGSIVTDAVTKEGLLVGKGVDTGAEALYTNLRATGYSGGELTSGAGSAGSYTLKLPSGHNLTGSVTSHSSPGANVFDLALIRDSSGKVVNDSLAAKLIQEQYPGAKVTREDDHYHVVWISAETRKILHKNSGNIEPNSQSIKINNPEKKDTTENTESKNNPNPSNSPKKTNNTNILGVSTDNTVKPQVIGNKSIGAGTVTGNKQFSDCLLRPMNLAISGSTDRI